MEICVYNKNIHEILHISCIFFQNYLEDSKICCTFATSKREEKDSGRWTTEMRLLARAKLTSDIRNPTIRTE